LVYGFPEVSAKRSELVRGMQMKKDYLRIQDFSAEELKTLVELISIVKKASKVTNTLSSFHLFVNGLAAYC